MLISAGAAPRYSGEMAAPGEEELRGWLLGLLGQESQDLESLFRSILEIVEKVVPVDAMFLALLRDGGSHLRLLETDLDDEGRRVFYPERRREPNTSRVLASLERSRYVLINRAREELERLRGAWPKEDPWSPVGNPRRRSASLLYVPVWFGRDLAGSLSVQSYREEAYGEADAERVALIGEYVGLALRRARLIETKRRRR